MGSELELESTRQDSVYVFLGPTLSREDAKAVLPAIYLPPASQGDVYRVGLRRPLVVGIIDGYFHRTPAIWHKEILWLMSQGTHVFGSSSLGAMRAAELCDFGMVGVGAIFEAFRDGELEDDDEVALRHGLATDQYRPLSEPMVNIRSTLDRAIAEGVIGTKTGDALKRLAKARFYPDRSYAALIEDGLIGGLPAAEIEPLRSWLPQGRVDQKRADAQRMLELMRASLEAGLERKVVRYHFEYTHYWDQFSRHTDFNRLESGAEDDHLSGESLLEEVCLRNDGWQRVKTEVLLRVLARRETSGTEVTSDQLDRASSRFRLGHQLLSSVEVDAWLHSHQINRDDLVGLLETEACVTRLESLFHSDIRTKLHDYLRLTGEFEALRNRAADKHLLLTEHNLTDGDLKEAQITEEELYRWFFERRNGRTVPLDIEAMAHEMGFTDGKDLRAALVREWHYTHLQEGVRQRGPTFRSPSSILEAGDPAPTFLLASPAWGTISVERLIGRPLLLVFSPGHPPVTDKAIRRMSLKGDPLVILIRRLQRVAEANHDQTRYVVLIDRDGVIHQRYHASEGTAFLLDARHHILDTFELDDRQLTEEQFAKAASLCGEASHGQPPVLTIPRVLSEQTCANLIELWRTGGNEAAEILRITGVGSKRLVDPDILRRRDYDLGESEYESRVQDTIMRRVRPELEKAFHFRIREFERMKIGCYDSKDQGGLEPHRDTDNLATKSRRFSMSINLNQDYEGGFVCFPEFGPNRFQLETGSALVFSASLLHAVRPVERGARLALITHLLGDFGER
jgi:predicted 2-oxoglutarate/Fe(II)-dependent dioxygenase YbiX